MNDDLRAAALHAATAFYDEHAPQYLSRDDDRLQELCGDAMALRYGITRREAMDIAMNARADMLSADAGGFIDMDRSTSRMVIVRDTSTDSVHMVPVSALLTLIRNPA